MTYQHWKFHTDAEHIVWLTIDRNNAGVNSLSREVLEEFSQILTQLATDNTIKGIVIQSAKASGFIAGADIEQFVALQEEEQAFDLVRHAQEIFDQLAAMSVPTVAMIKGFCLGGGLELALACRYRVADDGAKTQLGAPEVNLGLHPGWGGTIRLPRLIGVLPAMQMNLAGHPVDAKTAAKLGLVDIATPERHLQQAARHCIINQPRPHQPVWWQKLLNHSLLRPLVAKYLTQRLAQKVRREHYPAPYAILDNWLRFGVTGEAAMVQEARSIAQLMVGSTSRNLVRMFFLQTRVKGLAKGTRFTPTHVHVIGAGTMGGDIAAWCALKGMRVTLQDQTPERIAPAIGRAQKLYVKKLKSPRLVQAALDRLIPDCEGLGVRQADLVIEAVTEDLVVKQAIYRQIEPQLKADAILATNTSSLPLDELATVLNRPERFVGLHFFNPVAKMQLVEVVQSSHVDTQVVNQAMAFVRSLDRLPLPVKSCPGFLVNRVLMPYLMEAMLLLDEGVPATTIDQAAITFGMPMGPVELADTVGLDVCLAVANILLAKHANFVLPNTLSQKVAQGELGRKAGKGFYLYNKQGKKTASPTTKGDNVVEKLAATDLTVLTDRLILPLINEAVACLREGIVQDADLLDAGVVFGTGFAPFRGGPCHYTQQQGAAFVLEKLHALQHIHGKRFKPDAGWSKLTGKAKIELAAVEPEKG
jgi:3-hydroxyacyl-CoA dehydrogenase/enoyl-CoA hydratase/3-hydroxybutyryl-CoA epimerase